MEFVICDVCGFPNLTKPDLGESWQSRGHGINGLKLSCVCECVCVCVCVCVCAL